MAKWQTVLWTSLAILAFAANSLLCRLALRDTSIDPASFTLLRLLAGALLLSVLVGFRGLRGGSFVSAAALFAYAAAFSYAYVSLSAATGALLLFACVQISMVGYGCYRGERLSAIAWGGYALSCFGVLLLLAPGFTAPDPVSALCMAAAGLAWGVYSLRGRHGSDPTADTCGNFVRALPMAAVLYVALAPAPAWSDAWGTGYAIASGALASGAGYAIWYRVLPALSASKAAAIQLCVPVITATAGVLWLHEALSLRLVVSGVAILGGIALLISQRVRATHVSAD